MVDDSLKSMCEELIKEYRSNAKRVWIALKHPKNSPESLELTIYPDDIQKSERVLVEKIDDCYRINYNSMMNNAEKTLSGCSDHSNKKTGVITDLEECIKDLAKNYLPRDRKNKDSEYSRRIVSLANLAFDRREFEETMRYFSNIFHKKL